MRYALMLLGLVLVATSSAARATTWHVRQDGTADFTTIQAAVDASAPGDSIRVGAGRYLDYAYMSVGGNFNANVYVNVHVDSLTIIGEGADETIIGPPTLHAEPPHGPIGFLVFSDVLWLRLENLRVDHIYTGIYRWLGRLEIDRCAFSNGRKSIAAWTDGGLSVHASTFSDNSSGGISAFSYCENAEISSCEFINNGTHIYFDSAQNAIVTHCDFSGGVVGIQYSEGAYGVVSDCRFESVANVAMAIGLNSSATLETNTVLGGEEAVYIEGLSTVIASDNRFDGQTYDAVFVHNSTVEFHDNHFLNPALWAVYIPHISYTVPPIVELDFTGNYWGTNDPAQIAEWIWDGHDDSYILAVVDFEPLLTITPVEAPQAKSELKLAASPNPFNPKISVVYRLPESGAARLGVYDLRGRLVRSLLTHAYQDAGEHEISWDGRDDAGAALPSGTYLLQVEAGAEMRSLRVSLIR
jgi:hypothetical protein